MAVSNAVEEDLNDWYFVLDGFEKGVEAQLMRVVGPDLPVAIAGGGTAIRDSTLHVFLSSAEVTEEISCGGRWTSLKGSFCVYVELK